MACVDRENVALIRELLVFIEVLFGDVVFGNFAGLNFTPLGVVGLFYPFDNSGLEGIPFVEEFADAFRVRTFDLR